MVMYTFSKLEEPVKVFSVGHFFVWEKKEGEKHLYRISNVDYLTYETSGTLNANDSTGDKTIDDLVPEEGIMHTFFIGVKGPVKVYLKQPLTITRWGVGAIPGYVTQESSPIEAPNPSTFTVTLPETKFAINVENPLSEQVSYKIKFVGYKYKIEDIAVIKQIDDVTGNIYYEKVGKFPSPVIKEVLQAWIRGRVPELTTKGIVTRR